MNTRILVLLAVCLCACSSDDGLPSSPTTTVRMGFSAWPGWFPWQIALEKGFFEEANARVELTYFDSYTDSLDALANGSLDANTQTLNDTLLSVSGGSEQLIVLVNDFSTGNDQCIAREGILNVQDLRGMDVAVEFGVVDHFLLLLALRRAGVDASEVNIINLPTQEAAEQFAAGMFDAVCVFAPFTTTALEREGAVPLISSRTFPGAIPDYLVVSRELAANHPGDVQALVNTWWRVREFMANNPEEAVQIMAARAGTTVEEYESYASGTTLLSLEENRTILGPPPSPCDTLSDVDARLYTECTARAILSFDVGLIPDPISEELLLSTWTDEFVLRAETP